MQGGHYTTVITCLRQVGALLPDAYDRETIPQVGELDELETLIAKKNKSWLCLGG